MKRFAVHKIEIIRNPGTFDEQTLQNISADIQHKKGYFDVNTDIEEGDYLIVPHLKEPQVVTEIEIHKRGLPLDHIKAIFEPLSKFNGNKVNEGVNITQTFHGDVNNVAGNDINQNINITVILKTLQEAIEKSEEIPSEDKRSLLQTLKKLAENPYVEKISTTLLTAALKSQLPI